ncbi:PQQ-dependent sugar dehydrogenase [Rubrobacter marinus]|uniref:PQQ-dependent sugar dehydrogenase n=1 Tax=Rubrobacter marinus TaxID=2653852 RepID=A0A6G8PYN8_9ACTN|nr:PQQ-dependent sugar dehydrogenase [Rubrobacter marinus]QIN79288.1 PQQ-dependent sugar dehydrogenase [Rubrobacter marinus]
MPRARSAAVVALLALLLASPLAASCGSGAGQSEPRMVPQEDTGGEASVEGTQTTLAEQETPPPEDTATPEAEGESAEAGPVPVETSVVATGLEAPWDVAFLPGGEALVTERDSARLLLLDPSGTIEEVQTLPADGSGEGGLLGVAVSPAYDEDGLVYAYYTTAEDNRVVRFRLGEEPEPILTGIPVNSYHNGGRIEFGPDGLLYVGTGEAGDMPISQDVGSLGGKILRINPDGGVPGDNPFPGSPVYSYGHRNVQGLAWDEGGQLYATEFGQNTFDEVNRIEPGGNYGWPEVEGTGGEPTFVDPISTWATSEASPSGAAIVRDSGIPQWEGDFFMAALRGQRLWRLDLDGAGNLAGREELLSGEAGRLRHVAQAPDGSVWVLTNNRDGRGTPGPDDDRILKLAPAQG